MTERLDTPLAELLLARGLVGRPLLSEALEHVRRWRGQDEQISLALFLLERQALAPEVLERALQEAKRSTSLGDASQGGQDLPTEILGSYRLLRKIAEGGMGSVYEAEHTQTGVRYALKTIKAEVGELLEEEALERLRREARLSAALDHPGVVRVHAAEFEGAVPYLVQDLLTGGDLSQRVHGSGVLPPEAAAELVAQLAEGLAAAHAAGILHRDLKPDNVLFSERGQPVLVDFGLSRRVGGNSIQLTQSGEILGTPAYMAPEQALDVSSAREAADVYALGAILYFVLEGVAPFRGQTVIETLHMVISERAPEAERATPALRALLARVLSKEPQERPSAAELAELLRQSVRDPAPAAQVRLLALAAALATALLVVALIWARGRAELAPRPTVAVVASPTPAVAARDPELLAFAQTVREGRHRVARALAAVELLRRDPEHPAATVARGLVRSLGRERLLRIPALHGRAERGAGFLPGGKSLFSLSARGVGRFEVDASPAVWRVRAGPPDVNLSRGVVARGRLWISTTERRGWIYSLPLGQVGEAGAPKDPVIRPPSEWDAVLLGPQGMGGLASLAVSPQGRFIAHGQGNRVALYDLEKREALDLLQIPLDVKDEHEGERVVHVGIAHLEFLGEGFLVATLNRRFQNPLEAKGSTFPSGGVVALLKIEDGVLSLAGAIAVAQAVTATLLTAEHLYVGNNIGTLRRYAWESFPKDPRFRRSATESEAVGLLVVAKGGPGVGRVSGVRLCPDGTLLASNRFGEKGTEARLGRWTPRGEGWTYHPFGTTPLAQDVTLSEDGDLAFVEYHYRESGVKTHLGEVWFVGPIPGR